MFFLDAILSKCLKARLSKREGNKLKNSIAFVSEPSESIGNVGARNLASRKHLATGFYGYGCANFVNAVSRMKKI